MIEGKLIAERAEAEKNIEPLLRMVRQMLIETYMAGFIKGLKRCEESEEELIKRLTNEEDAIQVVLNPNAEEPLVKLKPDAILKRRLKQDEFPARVWNTFKDLQIETLGDILQCSEKFYLERPRFGVGSLNVIKKFVSSFGYKLREK
jgi:DNA-directed RNA polymerase alpha subunit